MKNPRPAFIVVLSLLFLPTSSNAQWVKTSGPDSGLVNCLAINTASGGSAKMELFAGTQGGGVFITTDAGTSWSPINVGLANKRVYGLATIPGSGGMSSTRLFAATGGGVFRSIDNGATWTPADSGLPGGFLNVIAVSFPSGVSGDTILFVGTDYGIYRSSDQGASWSQVTGGGPPYSVYSIAISDTIILAGGPFYVYRSTDRGTSWTQVFNLFEYYFISLAIAGEHAFAGGSPSVFHSTYPDTSWTFFDAGFPVTGYEVSDLAVFDSTIFAGRWGDGVYRRSLSDTGWTHVSEGLSYINKGVQVYCLALDRSPGGPEGRQLFAGTWGGGVWRRPLSEMITSVSTSHPVVPGSFNLQQNYPNPFNPSTTIKFELPRASQVTLTVYDILGREVSVLVNDREDAGIHEVKFDGANLASGVYFYRLQAGTYVETRKLLLLK